VVFGFHLGSAGIADEGMLGALLDSIFSQGATGVSFFFVLSGFVLAWSARPTDAARRFWRRRYAKIYPNHVMTWCAALVMAVVAGKGIGAAEAVPNLLLVQAWAPDDRIYFSMNAVSWSLACEAFFYLLFPLLHRGLTRIAGRMLWPATVTVFAAIWLVPAVVQLLPAGYHYWTIWIFPVARLPEFVAGMLLARIVREDRFPAIGIWPSVLLVVAAYVCCRWLPEDIRIVAATAVPYAILVAAVGAADAAGRATPWRARWLVRLGEVSFAFYLVHYLALRFVGWLAGTDNSMLVEAGLALSSLGLAIAASWVLYHLVERPGMRLLSGPLRRGSTPSPGEVPKWHHG